MTGKSQREICVTSQKKLNSYGQSEINHGTVRSQEFEIIHQRIRLQES